MSARPPAFVDCYGDLAERFSDKIQAIVPGIQIYFDEPGSEDELISRLQNRRHALVYMGFMSERVLKACPELNTIAYLSTGLATHGDLDAAKALGIRFEGVKGYGDRAVAEHTILLAMAGLKRLAEMDRNVRAGAWRLMRSEEFSGKTFGIIGRGGIGLETARIASALGARVIGWTRSNTASDPSIEMMELCDVLAQSDILSLHLALNSQTAGFLDAEKLAQAKPGVILINTARAGLVDESAMIAALQSGQIAHAGLDVFENEPLSRDHPLTKMDNVTLTPHSAWLTTQAIDRLLVSGMKLLQCHIDGV